MAIHKHTRVPRSGRLRILHLAFDDRRRPGSGGGAVRNHEINRRLARRHHVTAVTVTYPGARERVEDGVHYVPVGLPLGYYGAILTYFAALPFVVWTRSYDLLVEDFAAPFGSALVPLWARGTVLAQVQWLSAGEKSQRYHLPFFLTERWGARTHRVLIAVSSSVAARLREMNPDAEVVVLPNGLEDEAWQAARHRRRDVLYLGRLDIYPKGLDILLAAFAAIADRTDADLVVAGDGPGRPDMAKLLRQHGLEERVRLVGRVDGRARFDLLAGAQVVCMPSRDETFGLVALEAMACATPVVAFDIPAMRELLTPDASVIVPAFDVDAYAAALAGLLADSKRCRRMGAVGKRRARNFDWDGIAEHQEALYVRAASERTLRRSGAAHRAALAAAAAAAERVRVLGWPAALVSVGLVTFAVRALMVEHAFEIHADEGIYLRVSQNVARSFSLVYDLGGVHPFFLHPPLFFFIEAAYLRLLQPSGDAVQQVIAVRYLAAAFGAISGVVLFVLCRRLAGDRAAWAAAAIFALEPFIVRMNSRNLLESSALFWDLLGLLVLVRIIDRARGEPPAWMAPAAGLAFGAALLTNEPTAMITLLPLGASSLLKLVAVRKAGAIAVWAVAAYSIYPLFVALSGYMDQFWQQKRAGVNRFLGLTITTGFNGQYGPSFLHAVLDNWQVFAPTYALLGTGLLATIWLVFRPDPQSRLVACWSGSAYALQAYAVLFGTNEEQYFYYTAVLAVLAVVMAGQRVLDQASRPYGQPIASLGGHEHELIPLQRDHTRPGLGHARPAVSLALLTLFLCFSGYVTANRWVTPDDGYRHLALYLKANAPPGAAIGCTSSTEAVLLRLDGYTITNMAAVTQESRRRPKIQDPNLLLAGNPRYVILATRLVDDSYGVGTPELVRWLQINAQLVFTFRGPSDGTLEMFQVPES